MPTLPSGRRIEFSLDRFRAMLAYLSPQQVSAVADALQEADDLLHVMDAVHFSRDDGTPFFANYLATDWESCTSDWSMADREALRRWLGSESARAYRLEAIEQIKAAATGIQTAKIPASPARIALDGLDNALISATARNSLAISHCHDVMARRLH